MVAALPADAVEGAELTEGDGGEGFGGGFEGGVTGTKIEGAGETIGAAVA